jgi:hypothetical protein
MVMQESADSYAYMLNTVHRKEKIQKITGDKARLDINHDVWGAITLSDTQSLSHLEPCRDLQSHVHEYLW